MEGKVKRNTMFIRRRDCKERHAIITTTTIGTYTFYRFVILIKLMVTRSESSITLYPSNSQCFSYTNHTVQPTCGGWCYCYRAEVNNRLKAKSVVAATTFSWFWASKMYLGVGSDLNYGDMISQSKTLWKILYVLESFFLSLSLVLWSVGSVDWFPRLHLYGMDPMNGEFSDGTIGAAHFENAFRTANTTRGKGD